jgi:hypothetical protein
MRIAGGPQTQGPCAMDQAWEVLSYKRWQHLPTLHLNTSRHNTCLQDIGRRMPSQHHV